MQFVQADLGQAPQLVTAMRKFVAIPSASSPEGPRPGQWRVECGPMAVLRAGLRLVHHCLMS
jgi:hypothetical protein